MGRLGIGCTRCSFGLSRALVPSALPSPGALSLFKWSKQLLTTVSQPMEKAKRGNKEQGTSFKGDNPQVASLVSVPFRIYSHGLNQQEGRLESLVTLCSLKTQSGDGVQGVYSIMERREWTDDGRFPITHPTCSVKLFSKSLG